MRKTTLGLGILPQYGWPLGLKRRDGDDGEDIKQIVPNRTAMIVVDMQNDFVAPGGGLETPAACAMVPKLVEALRICRSAGIKVIYTTHVHRSDGSDMGLFAMHPPIANRNAAVDDTWGIEIYGDIAPAADEHVIKEASLQRILWHRFGHRLAGMGRRHGNYFRNNHRELLSCHRSRRDVPQLSRRAFI